MKKRTALVLVVIIIVGLLFAYNQGLLEIVPNTKHPVIVGSHNYQRVEPGEVLALETVAPINSINFFQFFTLGNDNPHSHYIGFGKTLTSDINKWDSVTEAKIESYSLFSYGGEVVAGEKIYLMVKVVGEAIDFVVAGERYTNDTSFVLRNDGTSYEVDGGDWGSIYYFDYRRYTSPNYAELKSRVAYALEIKIPEDVDYNLLSEVKMDLGPMILSHYTLPTVNFISGFSKVLTTDEYQWVNSYSLNDVFHTTYKPIIFRTTGDKKAIVHPGETWYYILKMTISPSSTKGYPYRAYIDDNTDLKAYRWTNYDDDTTMSEINYMFNFEIYGETDEAFFVDFTYTPIYPQAGEQITFTDMSNPGLINKWEWDFGDGTPISTSQNPTHTYAQDGNYTVRLVGTSHEGTRLEDHEVIAVGMTQPTPPEPETQELPWYWILGILGLLGVIGLFVVRKRI